MTVSAHIDALQKKHADLEAALAAEESRPMPDFTEISSLKKRKLLIKEELRALAQQQPKRANA